GRSPASILFVVEQDARRRTVEVVILTVAQRPEEGGQRNTAEEKRQRHEIDETAHRHAPAKSGTAGEESASDVFRAERLLLPVRSRSELATTMMDESDMASAAIRGVTRPAIASGSATAL